MKKTFILLLTYVMLMSGCSIQTTTPSDKPSVVCTSFPYYDFVKNIGGDKVEAVLLVPPGIDIHTFDPTPKDMLTTGNSNIFITNGGSSEAWAVKLVESLDKKPDEVMYMTEYVSLISEAGHIDEHIWTSPKNALLLSEAICERLVMVDSENADYYRNNLATYTERLNELDNSFKNAVSSGNGKTVIFGDRFPFLYLAKEYGFNYKAAFSGCSELTEPNARVVSELVEKVNEENSRVVFYVEFSNRKICDTICQETDAEPRLMHSAHNLTKSEFDSGLGYVEIMTENAAALKEALG